MASIGEVMEKTLAFILNDMKCHWRVLGQWNNLIYVLAGSL